MLLFTKVAQNLPLDFVAQNAEVIEDARSLHALALHSLRTGRQLDEQCFGVTMLPQELFHIDSISLNPHLSGSKHCQAAVDTQGLARDVGGVG